MGIKSAGTHLFFLNPYANPPAIVKFECPTGISGATSGTRERLPNTCLDDVDTMKYKSGLMDPGPVSVPFLLNTEAISHQQLDLMHDSGQEIVWIMGLSDGDTEPVITDGVLEFPANRSSIRFRAYVAELALADATTGALVTSSMTLQRTGKYEVKWKGQA